MSMRWHDRKHDDQFAENYEEDMSINWDEEIENASTKSARRQMVKRKLEDQMDKRRIRWEIDDYEQELDEGFDWGDGDHK
jgi:hypothetical protein